jgi:hypothetical protein
MLFLSILLDSFQAVFMGCDVSASNALLAFHMHTDRIQPRELALKTAIFVSPGEMIPVIALSP